MDDKFYVEINNLKKIIGGNLILNNINLKLKKGRIYGFRGKNGSGKTMLFRAVCGLIKPTEGSIVINNKRLHKDISFPSSIGVIIENPGFINDFTGFQNLKILSEIKNQISETDIIRAIKKVGLDPNNKLRFKKYSLGMKQRLGIAQAIMEKPELIVLDEPTNALDSDGLQLVREILLELKGENKTILIASHDREELEFLADEIFILENGQITSHEKIKEN